MEIVELEMDKQALKKFCSKYASIYIYGAGKYGQVCLGVLKNMNIPVRGFLVTDLYNVQASELCGIPIYEAQQVLVKERDGVGVILAMMDKYCKEVLPLLEQYRMPYWIAREIFFKRLDMNQLFQDVSPALRQYNGGENWEKILVVRLDVIGDMIWTTAFLRELKRNCPASEISLVVRTGIYPLIKDCPYVDKFIKYDIGMPVQDIAEEKKSLAQIRMRTREFAHQYLKPQYYDAVFLPTGFLCGRNGVKEFLLAIYSGAKERIFRVPRENSLAMPYLKQITSLLVTFDNQQHEILEILRLLEACGFEIQNNSTELWPDKMVQMEAKRFFKLQGVRADTILVAVGIVGREAVRSWDSGNYHSLIKKYYQEYGGKIKFVLFGGEDALEAARTAEYQQKNMVINMVNRTDLLQAVAYMAECDLYVGSNTGLLHMAVALHKPAIEIVPVFLQDKVDIGKIYWARMGAWGGKNIKVCPSQGLDECKGKGCCQKSYAHCINQITVGEVSRALKKMLPYVVLNHEV